MKILIIILLVVLVVLVALFYSKHKTIKCNSVLMITGAPKTGKSLLSVYLAFVFIRTYRFKWCLNKSIYFTFGFDYLNDFPELYSNIPLNHSFGYIPITKNMLLRKEKINEKSVFYLGEFSLVANSRLGQKQGNKNGIDYDSINEELLLFTKLCGHQFNGKVIIDSQTISDVHYSAKRVLSNYLYIHHSTNLLFHKVLWVQEMLYSDDNSSINVNEEDCTNKLKWLLVPKSLFKCYDFRCYSYFSDNLISNSCVVFPENLKALNIVGFVDYKTLNNGGVISEKKD